MQNLFLPTIWSVCIKKADDVDDIDSWGDTNKFLLNIDKCKFLPFTLKRMPFFPSYAIDGKAIELVDQMRGLPRDFKEIKCVNLLYNSLVRSQKTYDELIERIQKKYIRFLYWSLRKPKQPYPERFNQLEARRAYFDACLLYGLIHNPALDQLVLCLWSIFGTILHGSILAEFIFFVILTSCTAPISDLFPFYSSNFKA